MTRQKAALSTINFANNGGYVNSVALKQAQDVLAQESKDFALGFKERMSGFYDKWYRRNRKDEGTAYDRGVMAACETEGVPSECTIIECM
jgi:hypothetical protein